MKPAANVPDLSAGARERILAKNVTFCLRADTYCMDMTDGLCQIR
jgi:hypothetical protein